MEEEFLKKQKAKLLQMKKDLEKELSVFATKDKELQHNWKTQFPSFNGTETGGSRLEVAQDEVEEYANKLPVEHALELKLKNVNLALEKIEKGEYGICEKCKKEIPKERLEVCPEARLCVECEKSTEQ